MGDCKTCIKSIHEANVLTFYTNRATILCFVIKHSHEFSFVVWATIGLARKNLPNVNQFFESLYKAFRGFEYWSFPQSCFPFKMTVGLRRDPSAQMIGIMVAVSQFSFQNANCCCNPQGPICWVLWVHLSRKQQVSSITNIRLGSILYLSIVSWSNVYQWSMVTSFTAPPCTC